MGEDVQTTEYTSLINEILNDFESRFNAPRPQKEVVEEFSTPKPSVSLPQTPPATDNLTAIQDRLDRLEKRIQGLDENKPEYTEERVALEQKKQHIQQDILKTNPTLKGKDLQLQEVADLLSKKAFGYVAPVMSPVEEEKLRLKKAEEAAVLDQQKQDTLPSQNLPQEEKEGVSDEHLREASWMRESFMRTLKSIDGTTWHENPTKNRDMVNEFVLKTAQLLSKKDSSKIDMDDIQTARLFLFKKASEELLKHPAFAYVESFYNYQNEQGHSGNDLEEKTPSV